MAKASMKNVPLALDEIPCIYYPIEFKENEVWDLVNLGSKVNTITLKYVLKLCLRIRLIDVRAQKINGSILTMFKIVLASF